MSQQHGTLRICMMALTGFFVFQAIPSEGAADRTASAVTGVVTSLTGSPVARGSAEGAARNLALGDTVAIAEELRTQIDETVEILWDRRAVILVQPKSAVRIHENKAGDTYVDVAGGTVRVALAYGSRPTDIVTIRTPSSRVYTRGGIMEVEVLPATPSFLSRMATVFERAETAVPLALMEGVRVLEGQSSVEPLRSSHPSQILDAGSQARIMAGKVEDLSELTAASGRGMGLAAADRRQGTPGPLTQNIVRVHVDHALEVERLMSASTPAIDQTGKVPGADLKGAIVATSLGVPATSLTLSGGQSGFGIQTGGGGPSLTSPLPTLPPIQSPTVTTLVPNQSGGINSRTIINTVLSDDKNNKGKSKGH